MPAVWSRGTVCPVPRKRDCRIRESIAKKIQIRAHKRAGIWYHVRRQIRESLRSTHRLARLKPGKFYVCAKRSGGCALPGVFLFRGSHRAFPGPQTKRGQGVRPLSLPATRKRAKEKRVARIDTSAMRAAYGGRVARPARPYLTGTAAILAAYMDGHPARCSCPSSPPAYLSKHRHSKTLSFLISNPRKRLAPSSAFRQPIMGKQGVKEK
jgi:hypothetical protein